MTLRKEIEEKIKEEIYKEIDEWLEVVGVASVGKGLSYYYELEGCIEDGIKKSKICTLVKERLEKIEEVVLFRVECLGKNELDSVLFAISDIRDKFDTLITELSEDRNENSN